jgi:hypothetical protein
MGRQAQGGRPPAQGPALPVWSDVRQASRGAAAQVLAEETEGRQGMKTIRQTAVHAEENYPQYQPVVQDLQSKTLRYVRHQARITRRIP